MKTFLMSLIFLTGAVHARPQFNHQMDLDMTGPEYFQLLQALPVVLTDDPEDATLEVYLSYGVRNMQWVDLINKNSPPDERISLSSKATSQGYPIYAPSIYNFKIIQERWEVLRSLLPVALKKVIFDGAPPTPQLPVSKREFIEWMIQVDRAYQSSSRYKLMKPYLEEMKAYAAYDVRGYLKLRDMNNLDQTLQNWSSLPQSQQINLTQSLLLICQNVEMPAASCQQEFQEAVVGNTLVLYKNKYLLGAKRNYDSFFLITKHRSDVAWNAGNVLEIPFTNPKNDKVLEFLKFNIEEEFRGQDWRLQLNFVEESSPDITHVKFVPGSTPHVNDLAGSEITMDANALLSEYDVQWTIRHEYGHVLGLPDCYFEFYDVNLEAYVSYQFDITNLMCSRRGQLKQIHFDELARVYRN